MDQKKYLKIKKLGTTGTTDWVNFTVISTATQLQPQPPENPLSQGRFQKSCSRAGAEQKAYGREADSLKGVKEKGFEDDGR